VAKRKRTRGSKNEVSLPVATLVLEKTAAEVPCSYTEYSIAADDVTITLRCRFLVAETYNPPFAVRYNHPAPPFVRVFVFKKGGADLSVKKGNYALKPGRIYLIPDTQPFTVTYRPSVFHYFHLQVLDHSGLSVFKDLRGILTMRDTRIYDAIIEGMKRSDRRWVETLLLHVVARFCKPLMGELQQRVRCGEKYAGLLEVLQRNPVASLSVQDLSEMMHMSRSVFAKDFKRRMGISAKDYLQNVLHQRAVDLLLHTDLTILEIAHTLGYREPTYFHRVFKKAHWNDPANVPAEDAWKNGRHG